jgi:hypothetical protein
MYFLAIQQNRWDYSNYFVKMKHAEIRNRILFTLYFKYYTDQLTQPQVTDKVIEEAGLQFVEKNLVYGDIVYLKQSNLVKGLDVLGQAYPYAISITNLGIDVVDRMISDFIRFLINHDNPEFSSIGRTLQSIGPSTAQLKEIKGILQHKTQVFKNFIDSNE